MLTRTNSEGREARLRFLDNDLEIIQQGDFVCCAVSGRQIPIRALRYWDVDRQEAYADAGSAVARMGYMEE